MQFFTGISRNTQNHRCYHLLSVSGITKMMHYGMLIQMPYRNECDICAECSENTVHLFQVRSLYLLSWLVVRGSQRLTTK